MLERYYTKNDSIQKKDSKYYILFIHKTCINYVNQTI